MCEYCKEKFNKTVFESEDWDIQIYDNILDITYYYEDSYYRTCHQGKEIKINFCPMCGRKLGEQTNENL